MEKKPLEVPSLNEGDVAQLIPANINYPGLAELFGHMAPAYLKHIAVSMEIYTWFRYVEAESKSLILKRISTRILNRLLNKRDAAEFVAGNESGIILGEKAVGLTSRGINYKSVNEDAMGIFERGDSLDLVVCDGVGDCLVGEVASYVVLDEFARSPRLSARQIYANSVNRLGQLAQDLRKDVPEFLTFPNEVSQAAVTALRIKGDACEISQVGDVLVFLLRDRRLSMLNQDSEWLDLKELSKLFADSKYLSQRHIIKNAVGRSYDDQWEPLTLELKSGDLVVLASDGIETLHPRDVQTLLNKDQDLEAHMTALYEKALQANTLWNTVGSPPYTKPDNISLVVYRHP